MVNVNMLKAKIIEKNIEKKKIAECLGISSPSPPIKNNPKLVIIGNSFGFSFFIKLRQVAMNRSIKNGIVYIRCAYFFSQRI